MSSGGGYRLTVYVLQTQGVLNPMETGNGRETDRRIH